MSINNVFEGARNSLFRFAGTLLSFGTIWYVSSVTTTGPSVPARPKNTRANGLTPLTPFLSLAACLSSTYNAKLAAGDTIILMPGHVETVAAANGIDITTANLKIIGTGNGALKANVNFTATAATFRVNANGTEIENVAFTGGIDAVALCIDLNGKTDCAFRNCSYRDVTGQCTVFFKAANNSDRLVMEGWQYLGAAAAGTSAAFQFDGCDDLQFRGPFEIVGNFANSAIEFITTASARIRIDAAAGSFIWTQNAADLCIKDTVTGSTGNINGHLHLRLTDDANNITEAITGATFCLFDNIWVNNLAGEKAILINWTATTNT